MATKKRTRRQVIDAPVDMPVRITKRHIERAVCGDPQYCVIAQALREALSVNVATGTLEKVEVGSRITKVYVTNKEIRYATPPAFTQSIRVFDVTGQWELPSGEYALIAPPKSLRLGYKPPPHKQGKKRNLDPSRMSNHRPRLSTTRTVTRAGAYTKSAAQRAKKGGAK
jgi:hypothetical protein